MTQDAQKFTDGDLKKAKEITMKGYVESCEEYDIDPIIDGIAQALRDERNGLEDQVLHLNEFNVEAVERIKGLEDKVRELEAKLL